MGYSWVHMMVEYIAISAFTNGHLGCHISVQYRACYHFVKAGLKPKMSDFRHNCGQGRAWNMENVTFWSMCQKWKMSDFCHICGPSGHEIWKISHFDPWWSSSSSSESESESSSDRFLKSGLLGILATARDYKRKLSFFPVKLER